MKILGSLFVATAAEQILHKGERRALMDHYLVTVWALLEMELEDLVFLVRWQLVIDEEQQTLKHLIARNLIHVIHDRPLHD